MGTYAILIFFKKLRIQNLELDEKTEFQDTFTKNYLRCLSLLSRVVTQS